jgi:hypothetical protein
MMPRLRLRRWFNPAFLLLPLALLAKSGLAAQITAEPALGAVGTSVTIKGNGWPAGNVIDLGMRVLL